MISSGRRASSPVVAAVVMAILLTGHSAATSAGGTTPTRFRVLVKLRPSLAGGIERSVSPAAPSLSAYDAGGAGGAFMRRHSLPLMAPLYPSLLRAKVESRLTGRQLAQRSRVRFAARAQRLQGDFDPPDLSRTYVVELEAPSREALASKLWSLRADPAVEFAEEDGTASINLVPNDPFFHSKNSWGQWHDDLWGVKKIGAPAAWDLTAGEGVTVAVVDTGLDYNHVDIAANVWTNAGEVAGNGLDDDGNGYVDDLRGWDFIGGDYRSPAPDDDPLDDQGHGTHVAGTVAAVGNNGEGVIGVAWKSRVMPVKGLDRNGWGHTSALANAIVYAADNGADVINNSWGGPGSSQAIADAVAYAHSLGAVIVAAAGNRDGDASEEYPAGLAQCITVAATRGLYSNGTVEDRAPFSNWGSRIDVAAPGTDILSLRAAGTSMGQPLGERYTVAAGTSMASPHVAGLAALVLARRPSLTNEEVRQVLRTSADDQGETGVDLDFGHGRIEAAAALNVTSVLEAKIASPADMARITGMTSVSGVARGAGFVRYRLEYGAGATPAQWTLVQERTEPVGNAPLGSFDAASLADGVYTLRLTAFDLWNGVFVDQVRVVVDYMKITSPAPPRIPSVAAVFKPGTSVAIAGTAAGPSFQGFRVEWARGRSPEGGWSDEGVTLTSGGSAPVTDGSLADWDTASITEADYYTLRLLVDNAGFTSEARTLVYLEPDLLSANWPKWLPEAPGFNSGVVPVSDAAGDTRLSFVVPDYLGATDPTRLYTFSPDGASQTTIDLATGAYPQPAAADVDGSPGEETIVAELYALRVFRTDGTSHLLKPSVTAYFQLALVQVEDLDGDSQPEVLAVGNDYQAETAYLFAWRRDGQQRNAAFPIAMADRNWGVQTFSAPRVLVADMDRDGARDILYAEGTSPTTFTLRLVGSDGTPRPGWTAPTLPGYPSMALADLDRSGSPEIVVFARGSGSFPNLHVFQADGTERPGWPISLDGASHVAVGDLDRDGSDEVVVAAGSAGIHAFREDGTPLSGGWPVPASGGSFGTALALADVNGDGFPEVLVTRTESLGSPYPQPAAVAAELEPGAVGGARSRRRVGKEKMETGTARMPEAGPRAYPALDWDETKLQAIDALGQVVRSWRLLGARGAPPYAREAKPTVGDFDRDGTLDIAVVYQNITASGWIGEGVVTVLTTGAPFAASNADWPSLFHDPRNTASALRADQEPPSVTLTSPPAGSQVAGQLAVTASASDDYGVTGVQFKLDGVDLGPEDTQRPFGVSWDAGLSSEGPHTLTAVARDPMGRTAVSAPVEVTVVRDTAPPTVEVLTPRPGDSFVGKVTVRVEAADNLGVASIELWIDGSLRASSTSSRLSFVWDTMAEAKGEHHLVAKAYDTSRNEGSEEVTVTVASPLATYDATLRVPRCVAVNNQCDSSALLDGRGPLGPEPNQPNTINSSCADGTSGTYHFNPSNDRIRVFTLDGAPFWAGRTVRVEATVWVYGDVADRLDLYSAADAANPSWTWIATVRPPLFSSGRQILSATYTLPAGPLQAVRARYRYLDSETPCGGGSGYNDHDDLVFAVGENRPPVARPGGPYSAVRNQEVQFDGAGSLDPDDDPITYRWDFGDGAMATGPSPRHAYSAPGTYPVTLVVNDGTVDSAPATTSVTITNLAPSAVLTSPAPAALYTAPAEVRLAASAHDPDGSVALLEFFAGATKIGEDATSPYETLWTDVPAGSYELTARATDESGASGLSAPVTILVNARPSVTLTDPAPGAVFTAPAAITLAAAATDADGTVVQVEFFQGRRSLGVDKESPYTLTWKEVPQGAYELTARATDDRGAVTASATVSITVEARLTPVADAYVQDGVNAGRNFGSSPSLLVKKGDTPIFRLGNRWTYVKFDTRNAWSVGSARLRLFGNLSSTTSVRVRTSALSVADTSWGERLITWNNRPPLGPAPVATVTMDNLSTTPRWHEWDVTAYLKQEKAAGRHVVTLALRNEDRSSPYDVFNSREATADRPELVITPLGK